MKPAENYYCTFLNWKCKTDRIGLLKKVVGFFPLYHNIIIHFFMPILGKFLYGGYENYWPHVWKWVLRWVHSGFKKMEKYCSKQICAWLSQWLKINVFLIFPLSWNKFQKWLIFSLLSTKLHFFRILDHCMWVVKWG